jgi:hypothetical protein
MKRVEKKFYKKEEVLKTVIRDRRWNEVPMMTGDEVSPIFEWERMVDMIVWSQDDDCYIIVTYPIDHEGMLRNDVVIMDWESAIGGHAIESALTDGCSSSPYESLSKMYHHVCDDIDVREAGSIRDTLLEYLLYLMRIVGHGHYDYEEQEKRLEKALKLWDWQIEKPNGDD